MNMKQLRRVWNRFRGLSSARRRNEDLIAELESHIQMQTEDNIRAGMPPAEAHRAAMIKFGSLEHTKEHCRDEGSLPFLETMIADIRYAGRSLRQSPGFTVVALLTLALAIGANTAIFSLVDQILLHPPGVSRPERIVVIRTNYDKLNLSFDVASPRTFADVRGHKEIFEHVAATRPVSFNYAGQDQPARLSAAAVSVEWFDVFGAKPERGRVFSIEEDKPGTNRVAVLAYGAWMRLFGGDPRVLGQTIELGEQPYRVVGVMGREFGEPKSVDLWVPLALSSEDIEGPRGRSENLSVFARRQATVSFSQADAWLRVAATQMLATVPPAARRYLIDAGWRLGGTAFADSNAGTNKTPLLILLAAVGLVLLIACANIGGLMVARTSARARELAVRAALGAARGRLLRQILTESLVLAIVGGTIGFLLARGGVELLLRLAPESAVAGLEAGEDITVLLFTVGASLAAAVFFGLVPAWQTSRVDPGAVIKSGGQTASMAAAQRLRSGLVVAESALALVLLVSAGQFLRSFTQLQRIDPGFEPRGVVTAAYALPQGVWTDPQKQAVFTRSVLERLLQAKGVTAAAIGRPIPFAGGYEGSAFFIEGRTVVSGEAVPQAERRWVTPDYVRTLGVRLERGRFLTDSDRTGTELVAVIDAKLARQYFPGEDPLGKRIRPTSGEGSYTIVGVVNHVVQSNLAADTDRGVYYNSLFQRPAPVGFILVKASGEPAVAVGAIHDAVQATDRNLPLYDIKTMESLLAESLSPRRFVMQLMAIFAVAALLLAALGLYGVVNYVVAQRKREIAIRVALGAERKGVLMLVVGQGLRLAGVGVAIGMVGAVVSGKLLESQLFQVNSFDSSTIAATAGVLLGAALVASYLPARRAVRVDPAVTLRYE
jgi:predicted permease